MIRKISNILKRSSGHYKLTGHKESVCILEFFLDSACPLEIVEGLKTGFISGVTTNPSLLAHMKERDNIWTFLRSLCTETLPHPISIEVMCEDEAEMMEQSQKICRLGSNVVVKLPLTRSGLTVCRFLVSEGIQVNVTLCFSVHQALLAAKAGATYISPFVGRLEDYGENGWNLIAEMRQIFDRYQFRSKILAASMRCSRHVVQAALAGADVATMPAKVFQELFHHPLTEKGLSLFKEAYQNLSF